MGCALVKNWSTSVCDIMHFFLKKKRNSLVETCISGMCMSLHQALKLVRCNNLEVSRISSKDSPQMHVAILESSGVNVWGLTVTAPGSSPNTDGIHIGQSQNVRVAGSRIGTGDRLHLHKLRQPLRRRRRHRVRAWPPRKVNRSARRRLERTALFLKPGIWRFRVACSGTRCIYLTNPPAMVLP